MAAGEKEFSLPQIVQQTDPGAHRVLYRRRSRAATAWGLPQNLHLVPR